MAKAVVNRAALVAIALALVGCEEKKSDTATASAPASATATTTGTATAPGSATATATATAWAGGYVAKVGKIDLPKDLNQARATDDGKSAIGPGNVTINVAGDGDVSGKIDGSLGKGTITGRLEGESLRASIFPDEQGPMAMAGVVMGTRAGDVIKGDIRVSGPDASVVREASFELKKK